MKSADCQARHMQKMLLYLPFYSYQAAFFRKEYQQRMNGFFIFSGANKGKQRKKHGLQFSLPSFIVEVREAKYPHLYDGIQEAASQGNKKTKLE